MVLFRKKYLTWLVLIPSRGGSTLDISNINTIFSTPATYTYYFIEVYTYNTIKDLTVWLLVSNHPGQGAKPEEGILANKYQSRSLYGGQVHRFKTTRKRGACNFVRSIPK
ncbi:hypothetical protein F4810DRAFT_549161 [Camillea tinctor]|nr:hypothetical protein F4810DRAFT_549161 [Camillea tinctor]